MNISSVANSYLKKNITISEIEENEINKYNNIMIPENINPTDLINHLYNKISSDKIHYNNLIRGQSYSFAVDVKNEDKVFNDKKWSYIEYNNTSKGNNYKNHDYYYLYNKEYCIVKFIIDSSTNDISELEKEFMNNISFE